VRASHGEFERALRSLAGDRVFKTVFLAELPIRFGSPCSMRLEDLQPNIAVRDILPEALVTTSTLGGTATNL
jgi:hypothetical protein